MEVCRSVEVKLDVDETQAELLQQTIDEYLWAANFVVDAACEDQWVETSHSKLHDETYQSIREQTRLHSNHVQSARDSAASALQGTVEKWKRGKQASLPTFESEFCVYNRRNATFGRDSASLSTVDGRISVDYLLPDADRETPHARYLFGDDWETSSATLHHRHDDYYLHILTKKDVDDPESGGNGTVLGVDLGIENLAVTSTGKFWSGQELEHWRREYTRRRRSLQLCGTTAAHENIKAVGQKETGRFDQHLHTVAKEILREAVENGCTVIAFEDLTDIRQGMVNVRKLHHWAFRRLYDYVAYKAEIRGVAVEQVNPHDTSRRCSTCGYSNTDNRQTREQFRCESCGYENHADYNAAKNIGYRLLRNQTEAEGGAPVGVRLNTGMLTTNGVISVPETAEV
jgi:putative transposase